MRPEPIAYLTIGAALACMLPAGGLAGATRAQLASDTLRIRGEVLTEGGGPVADARIRTDALRGITGSQFTGQREFTVRTGKKGDWALVGISRGLWLFEASAADHLPHVIVVPISMMRRDTVPWETSLALQAVAAIRTAETPADSPVRFIIEAADRAMQDDRNAARETLRRLDDSKLGAEALCAAGDVALCIREPAWASRFFEMAAHLKPDWYRPHLGVGSAAMAQLDFDKAVKGYVNARDRTKNRRLQQMLSAAVRDLQLIKSVG